MRQLLMLGDSLVEWGDWASLLPEVAVINRGRAGEMTEELASRLMDEFETCHDPDAILIESGTNNFLSGFMIFPAMLTTMLMRLRACYPDAPIILSSLMPLPLAALRDITKVNEELAEAAEATENCHFLDTVPPFQKFCLPITKPGFLNDQVHLSTHGYLVWAQAIRELLQRLFPDGL